MKAGRELDAEIAEKVFGYTKQFVPKDSLPNVDIPLAKFPRQDSWLFVNAGGFPDYFVGHVNDMYVDQSRGWKQTLYPIPSYSEDIAAAWEVVEKLRKDFDVVLECVPSHFNCHINKPNTAHLGLERNYQRADSAPHAICLAALKALSAPPATKGGTE